MNDAPSPQANAIKQRLTQHQITVLAVTEPSGEPDWFTVYLHRAAGNDDERGTAVWVLTRMIGVREVRVNKETPMIVRVRYVLG
jgi:hypothetical protein